MPGCMGRFKRQLLLPFQCAPAPGLDSGRPRKAVAAVMVSCIEQPLQKQVGAPMHQINVDAKLEGPEFSRPTGSSTQVLE